LKATATVRIEPPPPTTRREEGQEASPQRETTRTTTRAPPQRLHHGPANQKATQNDFQKTYLTAARQERPRLADLPPAIGERVLSVLFMEMFCSLQKGQIMICLNLLV